MPFEREFMAKIQHQFRANTKISPYIYGTTRLGDESIPFADRVKIARKAMDAGIWFHTSHTYGNALEVLRAAFDEDPGNITPAIFKIGWDSIEQIRETIDINLKPLALNKMAGGQLCLGTNLANELRAGGPCYNGFRQLKEDGLVEKLTLEIWPWTSEAPYKALKAGYTDGIIDAYSFYLNPLQRFVSNELWDLLMQKKMPIVAIRTVGGGLVHGIRDNPNAPEYLRKRAAEVAPIYERSGCKYWTEFCIRFAFGVPHLIATIGATSKEDNLNDFLNVTKQAEPIEPLAEDIQMEIYALQTRWADEHDRFAEPWSM